MTTLHRLSVNDPKNNYFIQKNEQNSLKGLLWSATGTTLTGGALGLTGLAIGIFAGASLASMGIVTNDYARNWMGPLALPLIMGGTSLVVIVDYAAVKFTGYCMSNAIHHLGPEYNIVAYKKA